MAALRKKLPFYCLHRDTSGKPDHLGRALTDSEGDVCAECVEADKQGKTRFFAAPIVPAIPIPAGESLDQLIARRKGLPPIWPTVDA